VDPHRPRGERAHLLRQRLAPLPRLAPGSPRAARGDGGVAPADPALPHPRRRGARLLAEPPRAAPPPARLAGLIAQRRDSTAACSAKRVPRPGSINAASTNSLTTPTA